ncbi:MAG: CotH kinase family protein [Oscillospiraceae bacterium]|nr:CotH kinase family protein [Oscillospiraceae bacterium]
MKNRLFAWLVILAAIVVLLPAAVPKTGAAAAPTKLWVAPTEVNGLPAQIDVFRKKTGGTTMNPTYTYLLCLPGNAILSECFLSWDGDLQATVGGAVYDSGSCPIPSPDQEKTYAFKNGNQTLASFKVKTYQGSPDVPAVFLDVDESNGNPTIAQMDGDPDHNVTCTGRINVGGTWYDMPKLKGRGNATWETADDKKPYNVTTDKKIAFPGIGTPSKKWSFLAENLDRSLMGNRSGFFLAQELGIGQETASADVWMNGEYQGCYTVTPKTDSFVPKDGFLIEQDNYLEPAVADGGDPQFTLEGLKEASGWSSCYNRITVKKMGDNLLLKDGAVDESPENLEAAAENIRLWLQDAWDAIRSDTGYNAKGKYYTEYIDLASFAKMYLMHEYVKSYDVCAGSILYHRDGQTDADKLIAGPLWDLDNAMGSTYRNSSLGEADDRQHGDRRSGQGDFIPNITEYKTSVYKTLGRHADFMEEVFYQYNKHRAAFDALEADTARMIGALEASALMNHAKVNDLGNGTGRNNHYYRSNTVLGTGDYQQTYVATQNWADYTANLLTYLAARTRWFGATYYDPDFVDPDTCAHNTDPSLYETTVVEATCLADGSVTYVCPICRHTYTEVLPRIPHDYRDGACVRCGETLLTASIVCSEGASVTVYETQDLDGPCVRDATSANPRSSDTGFIDCSGDGQINFVVELAPCYEIVSVTAAPSNSYKNLKLPADLGIENGYRLTKVKGDLTITVTATAAHNYETVVTAPTCTEAGFTTYTCSDCGDSYVGDPVPATGHAYGAPTYEWIETADGWTVTATAVCSNDPAHVETETVTAAYEVTAAPTCTSAGVGTYTATFTIATFETQTKKVDLEATGHAYGAPTYE